MSDDNDNKKKFRYSLFYENWIQFRKNKAALLGLALITIFMLIAILAPLLATHDPLQQSIANRVSPPGTKGYILGSDGFGRDVYSRILYGSRISLLIGVISVSISLAIGLVVGLLAGYYGGLFDIIVMRIIDIMLAFPYIILAIVIVSILGPSLENAMIAIGVVGIPKFARLIRSSVLAEKELDYVVAERSLGASDFELIFRSILPNCLAPIIVQATLSYAGAILSSAALSFLGLGARPPIPEWGLMLASSRSLITTAWWAVTFPGLAILFSVLGFNLLGDGLRDVLDPRLKD